MQGRYVLKLAKLIITAENDEDPWNCNWIICFKDDHQQIGVASFIGDKAAGTVPLNVELEERFRNQGYGTEIIRSMANWAFLHRSVFEVVAFTEHENDKAVMALQKAGFVYRETKEGIETYSVFKEKTVWTGVYLMIGIVIGLALALILNAPWVGLGIGLFISLAAGISMDAKENRERERIIGGKYVDKYKDQ